MADLRMRAVVLRHNKPRVDTRADSGSAAEVAGKPKTWPPPTGEEDEVEDEEPGLSWVVLVVVVNGVGVGSEGSAPPIPGGGVGAGEGSQQSVWLRSEFRMFFIRTLTSGNSGDNGRVAGIPGG